MAAMHNYFVSLNLCLYKTRACPFLKFLDINSSIPQIPYLVQHRYIMASTILEKEDHSRDAAFNKAMHKNSAGAMGGFSAMMKKDKSAQKAAVDEYFKHWDQKAAATETVADREVSVVNTMSIDS
jgi:hypothetical protein